MANIQQDLLLDLLSYQKDGYALLETPTMEEISLLGNRLQASGYTYKFILDQKDFKDSKGKDVLVFLSYDVDWYKYKNTFLKNYPKTLLIFEVGGVL